MKFSKWLIFGVLLFEKTYGNGIDVYGTSPELSKKILDLYGNSLQHIEETRTQLSIKHGQVNDLERQATQLKLKIEKQFGIKKINIDTVFYPENQQIFTTINICQQANEHFTEVQNYKAKVPKDIIDRMHFFIPKAIHFLIKHPEYALQLNCQDFHCITPENPEVKKELIYFRKEAPLQTDLIEKTLLNDRIIERRRAAIFLLGYYSNPQKINTLLIKLLNDNNPYIRHDALRVYGELYAKSPNLEVPLDKVIPSIYSCDTAERNKALILINELAKNPKYKKDILQKVGVQLVELLKLYQPNNHLFAYSILKKITQQNYSDHDYSKWNNWISSHRL